jgi:thiol:disulfide interchange protein
MLTPSAVRRAFVPALLAAFLTAGACARRESSGGGGESKVPFASLKFDEALGRARTQNRLVMVDVYTDWCGWCKKMDRDTFGDARVAEALKEIIPIKVNAEKGGEAVAQRYEVRGFPTVLFLSGSGEVVKKIEGYVGAEEMLKIVRSLPKGT